MARRKKAHFAEMKEMLNVFEYPENMKGNWGAHFNNENPIWLEVGCGKGEYTIGLAKLYPEINIIGIDIKGSRMWHGAKRSESEGLDNAAFLRIRVEQILDFFAEGEVDRVWITFPDPQPRESKEKKRLTSTRFLNYYKAISKPGSTINLKTDNTDLYNFSVEEIQNHDSYVLEYSSDNIYSAKREAPELDLKTAYEIKFLSEGLTIKYLRATII